MTTYTLAIDGNTALDADYWGNAITRQVGNHSSLGAMPWSVVANIEFLPGVRIGDDIYVVPEEWLPHGPQRRRSFRSLRSTVAVEGPGSSALNESLKRSLVAFTLARRTETGQRKLKYSSWLGVCRRMLAMAAWAVTNVPSSHGTLWAHLTDADWARMSDEVSRSLRDPVSYVRKQLIDLGRRGVLLDAPMAGASTTTAVSAPSPEQSIRAAQAKATEPARDRSYRPFSDEFVTAIISRAMWIQDNLADQLIECWIELRDIKERAIAKGRRASHPTTTEERRSALRSFDWRDGQGKPLDRLPWPILSKESGKTILSETWPPKDAAGVVLMIGVLQALNYAVVNFCAGARSSEILAAVDSSLNEADGRFVSRTFKVIDGVDGQVRDWPLHPVGIRALQLQIRLAKVVRPEDADHMWVLLKEGDEPAGYPLRNINEPMVRTAKALQIDDLTEDTRPHSHRWRHTVARLVALSVAAAPQVLMDLFGHRDLEMTLRYMLSDPEIVEEALQVANEAARALAEEAVRDVLSGEAGGPAAAPLKKGLDDLRMRRGEDILGAVSLQEALEVLTFSGRQWHAVRPGVICTKGLGQFGPCTQGRGEPDPGTCRTGCNHRLETARAKAQCESTILKLLDDYAAAAEMPLLQAALEGQILANLRRFEDVRIGVLSQSPTAALIWAERKEGAAA